MRSLRRLGSAWLWVCLLAVAGVGCEAPSTNGPGDDAGVEEQDGGTQDDGGVTLDEAAPITAATPAGGTFREPQSVTLTCTDGSGTGCAATYYTLDGTTPTAASARYTAPLTVATSATLKFFSVDLADNAEAVHTESYVIEACPPAGGGMTLVSIPEVQGAGETSPRVGQTVSVDGVVVADFRQSGGLSGFFLQARTGDGDPATSDGVFVYVPAANPFSGAALTSGDLIRVTGTVKEYRTSTNDAPLTELDSVSALQVCARGVQMSPTVVTLPQAEGGLERYEGMWVTFAEPLTVSETYNLGRYGELVLSSGGRLYTPTNGQAAGTAPNAQRRLVLDDGKSPSSPSPIPYLSSSGKSGTRRVGDQVSALTGVLSYGFGTYRVQPTVVPDFEATNPRTTTPAPVHGDADAQSVVRVASFNVLNYFTTFGQRGADNLQEFERQRAKIVAALRTLDADVVGLIELENNATALADLVGRLNMAYGVDTYAAVADPSNTGTDQIKVAFIYKPSRVQPLGGAVSDGAAVHNRPPVAQVFRTLGSGAGTFTAVVNHFKSKGSCPSSGPDADQGDGQSCWNTTRVSQAQALLTFLQSMAQYANDEDILVMGDLNSYGDEDPIDTLLGGGLTNLALQVPEAERYSYVFMGESGYLDHALASSSMAAQVEGMTFWHINADEPPVLDYNLNKGYGSASEAAEPKPDDRYEASPYRSSDHDPVLLGIAVSADDHLPTAPSLTLTGAESVALGASFGLGLEATPAAGSTLTGVVVDWGDGSAPESLPVDAVSAQHVYTAAGTYTVQVTVTASNGQSVSQSRQVQVKVESSSAVVISQVYGGGGSSQSSASYKRDFVELFNRSSQTVDIGGWSVQYKSATGTGAYLTGAIPASTLLTPGQSYLVAIGNAGTGGADLPAADLSLSSFSLAAGAGRLALVREAAAITCDSGCKPETLPTVEDAVSYGTTSSYEGTVAAPALSISTAALRLGNGCQDTNDNGSDFQTGTPEPRRAYSACQ
ncbi:MAG: ExeM/NucH family extracellular endonuclease [Myxococcaceae bacterium]|nr:ExeM/NucH family extracellular endonuclease [Myxococcaceae bacterium]MCI0672132.1 ExeM/NucH family extracellular endonuclease [Myxococcaceae bacterium]